MNLRLLGRARDSLRGAAADSRLRAARVYTHARYTLREHRDRKALIKDEIARFIEEANNKAEIEAYNHGKGVEVAEEDGQDEHEGEDNGGALGGTRSWAREALRKKGKGPAPKKKIEKKKGGGGAGGFSKQVRAN